MSCKERVSEYLILQGCQIKANLLVMETKKTIEKTIETKS